MAGADHSTVEALLATEVERLDGLILRAKGGVTEVLAGEFCTDLGEVRTSLEAHRAGIATHHVPAAPSTIPPLIPHPTTPQKERP